MSQIPLTSPSLPSVSFFSCILISWHHHSPKLKKLNSSYIFSLALPTFLPSLSLPFLSSDMTKSCQFYLKFFPCPSPSTALAQTPFSRVDP